MPEQSWTCTKFVVVGGSLRACRKTVSPGSWLTADRQAECYGDLIRRFARERLLDLGCGSAPLKSQYERYSTWTIRADWPLSLHQAGQVDVYLDLRQPLPFVDGAFDSVLLTDVLEHTTDPSAVVREIARVLSDGGRLLAGVPFFYWIHEEPHDFYRFTQFGLRHLASGAELEVESLQPYGGILDVFADLLSKAADRCCGPRVSGAIVRGIELLRRLCLAIPGAARLNARSTDKFPLGYAMVMRKPAAETSRARGDLAVDVL